MDNSNGVCQQWNFKRSPTWYGTLRSSLLPDILSTSSLFYVSILQIFKFHDLRRLRNQQINASRCSNLALVWISPSMLLMQSHTFTCMQVVIRNSHPLTVAASYVGSHGSTLTGISIDMRRPNIAIYDFVNMGLI